jgi:hypothetical protein
MMNVLLKAPTARLAQSAVMKITEVGWLHAQEWQ